MASDVCAVITSSGAGFFTGVTTVACDEIGNRQRVIDSGSAPSRPREQFTKQGINDFTMFNKLKDRMDDITYYG